MFRIGIKRDLVENDIYDVVNVCESKKLGDDLESAWKVECKKEKPSFLRMLIRVFGKEYFIIGAIQLFYIALFM